MGRWATRAMLVVLVLGPATPAAAQRTTGTIAGTVSDATGAVLPGVTVTLRSDAVPGTPTTVTSETGGYRFVGLPPGTYNLTFEVSGFTTLNQEGIIVGVGATVELNPQLKVSTLAESITVSGESPVVNTASTQVSTNFNREHVANIPQRRFTFFDLINQAPGVQPTTQTSSRSVALGSNTTDNSYQLDGTDFTAPLTGAAWPWPNTDAIEEVEVLQLGASAEYGNVQGAVFNVVTRQGGNALRGDGNFYYQHQNLTGRNTNDDVDDGLPYNRDRYVDTTWQLGGPIKKDRFWFFGSYQHQRDYESQPGTPPEFPAKFEADRVFGKLNYQINTDQKLMFAYHDDYYRIPGRATALTAPSTIVVEHGHNPSPNVSYTNVLSPKTVLEVRYSGFYGIDHGDPLESGQPRVQPRFNDLDSGQITGGIYSWYDGDSWKTGFNGKVTHYAERFLGGSHDLKLGVQYNSGGSDYVLGPNDYIYTYSGIPAYGYTQLPWHQGGQMNSIGVFMDDTFRIGSRVTLNLGLRYDRSTAGIRSYPVLDAQGKETGAESAERDGIFTWNSVSPRVGVVWKLNESGRTVLKAHVGRYYRGIVTGEYDNTSPSVTPRFYFEFDSRGNRINLEKVSDNLNLTVDPNFKNPYTDQFIVGLEHELVKNLGLMVNYTHKRGENYGGWRDIAGTYVPVEYRDTTGVEPTNQTFTLFRLVSDPDARLFQLTSPDRMFSRYNGLIVQAVKRLSDNWQGTFSVVLSKSTGRIGSSLSSPTASQFGTAGVFGQNPNDFVNTEGRLIADRPVMAKAQVVVNLPWRFLAGANVVYQTGRLWSRQVRVAGLGFPSRPTINTEANTGDRRVRDQTIVDLRLEKDFRLGGTADAAIFGDLLNVFNSDANQGVLARRADLADTFGDPSLFVFPRRLMVGAKIRF
ncbi:MAG: TonB-dependent receptor [Vicinamibacterales bacterium]